MEIKKYIESGVLESYVLGSASEAETRELLQLKKQFPEIQDALFELETDLERIARDMAIVPPPGLLTKIEDNIKALANRPDTLPQTKEHTGGGKQADKDNHFIEVESASSHMRIHKAWRWVFAAVFVLSKIFLIASIYYYLENRHAQAQIEQLKTELNRYHTPH
ncbi:hypothetical protein [Mucilaginibacter sp. UR6-11]|uniref:hypothetical protein n=1 Tax=Mucilaginibacter sp. UR6-11 TaxID=1435644 RepID=UPI001E60B711|nr:hypothetical protein [Mucilaginibacter sp. UR6-11]MCC8423461.1 hypothetical protein [Mucilaginibacter sp. UR6-11]